MSQSARPRFQTEEESRKRECYWQSLLVIADEDLAMTYIQGHRRDASHNVKHSCDMCLFLNGIHTSRAFCPVFVSRNEIKSEWAADNDAADCCGDKHYREEQPQHRPGELVLSRVSVGLSIELHVKTGRPSVRIPSNDLSASRRMRIQRDLFKKANREKRHYRAKKCRPPRPTETRAPSRDRRCKSIAANPKRDQEFRNNATWVQVEPDSCREYEEHTGPKQHDKGA